MVKYQVFIGNIGIRLLQQSHDALPDFPSIPLFVENYRRDPRLAELVGISRGGKIV
jgi:hypothetical protein